MCHRVPARLQLLKTSFLVALLCAPAPGRARIVPCHFLVVWPYSPRQGILETQNFKGEALVVYHTSKFTGTHDAGVGNLGQVNLPLFSDASASATRTGHLSRIQCCVWGWVVFALVLKSPTKRCHVIECRHVGCVAKAIDEDAHSYFFSLHGSAESA